MAPLAGQARPHLRAGTCGRKTPYQKLCRMHELLRSCKDVFDQRRRRSLGIDAQERLSSRGTKKHPRLGAVSITRRLKEKLDPVHAFLFCDRELPQTRCSIASCTRNGSELDGILKMKIAPAVEMLAIFLLQLG